METFDQCVTLSGVPCAFPFNNGGTTYTGCTTDGGVGGRPWCATEVDEDGDMVRGKYGNCFVEFCEDTNNGNETETTTTTTTTTTAPEPCEKKEMKLKGGKLIKKFKKIKTWEECAEKCENKCKAWTYRPKMKNQKKALECYTYSKYSKFVKDTFTVSGTSDCPPPTPVGGSATETTTPPGKLN